MTPTDAIDELVARSKDHRKLRAFHEFHKKHPEVLDFLVQEIQLRIDHGFKAFAFGSLWEYARWKLEMDSKRLTNTPVREAGSVLKCPDGRKNRVVSAQATHPCGNSAVGGGVYEQRHATHRVLSESGFELRHA